MSLSMNLPETPYILAGALAVAVSAYIYLSSRTNEAKAKQAGARLPPGPERLPLVGNLFNFPKDRWLETFTSWGKQYGDVVYINLVGTPMIVLNSLEAAEDLAIKRASTFSGRPYTRMVLDLMGAGFSLIFTQLSREFNEQRKLFRLSLGPQVVGGYDNLIQQTVESFIGEIRDVGDDPHPRISRTISTIITIITYGEEFYRKHGEELVQLNVENTHLLAWAFTKFWAVDVIPFLRYIPEWFPGASFKRLAKIGGDQTSRIRYWAFGAIKDAVAKGTADESLVSKNLNDAVFAEPTIRDATAIMYSAGVDTTTTSIINMFYNLVLHPEWQVKLQKELDEVVGRGNLPTAQEIPKLKLFNAAWKEALRLHPPGSLGICIFST
ncbi:hypothetical protein FRC17_011240 [Serendipita sp. 399]|nr:hypothetical protein FRC17_011240 [Serendipita sp. 399]